MTRTLNKLNLMFARSLAGSFQTLLAKKTCVENELAEGLSRIYGEVVQCRPSRERPKFSVASEGHRLPLHPVIRDEAYHITREAVVNAFRHSHAKNIEIEVKYRWNCLRIVVRDDGSGIDPELLAAGRHTHWGLSNMRTRAERIGARLRLWSGPRCGTELELSIPRDCEFHDRIMSNKLRTKDAQALEAAR